MRDDRLAQRDDHDQRETLREKVPGDTRNPRTPKTNGPAKSIDSADHPRERLRGPVEEGRPDQYQRRRQRLNDSL